MKSLIYLIAISLTIMSCQKEKTVESIVNDFEEQISKSSSWQYDIRYKMKFFSADDTLKFFSNCRLIRHESDTIFGGSFWIANDSIDRYYDLKHIYIIDHRKKKITRYFPEKGQHWAINGHAIRGVLDSYFFTPNLLSKYLNDSTIIAQLNDSIISENKLQTIEFRFQDELPIEQQRQILYFNNDNQLKNISYSSKFQNQWQYNEWQFSNEKYNSITDTLLKSEFDNFKNNYSIEDYEELDPKEMEPLANGLVAPPLIGFSYQANDSIRLNDYKNKYIILDFWYKSCLPCIEAIPTLNKLRAKYAEDQLAIFGLNPFDGKSLNKEKLDEFIKINEMGYPTVFVDNAVTKDYNVIAYPTFYIIDTKGKIIYSKIGHSEKNEKEIDSLLNNLIK